MQLHAATRSIILPAVNLPAAYTYPVHRFQMGAQEYAATPCRRDVCAALNLAGYWPSGPIQLDYSWPGKYTPMLQQRVTADYLTWHRKAFVFNEIGTGKTLSALWAMDYLMRCGEIKSALIITTLSTIRRAWGDELDKHLPHLDYTLLHAARATRLRRAWGSERVKIINHDGVKTIHEDLHALVERGEIGLIIVDEGAEFSNAGSDKYKALKWICGASKATRVWWLTGSPMPHSPTDIWAQGRVICPDLLPPFYSHWRDKVMRPKGPFTWVPRDGWLDIVSKSVAPVIRFRRAECVDLPPTTFSTVEVSMTREQQQAYDEMRVRLKTEIGTTKITAVNEAVKLGKLIQITCGAVYSQQSETARINCGSKVTELIRLIREANGVALVFVSFRSALDTIADALRAAKIRHARVDGSISSVVRDKVFQSFSDGLLDVIIAHPRTMAHGLTLTRSSVVIWFGPPQSYRIYEQANGRITRPGQRNATTIINLLCSDVEREVYARLNSKKELQGLLLDVLQTAN